MRQYPRLRNMRVFIFLLVFGLTSLGTAVNSGVTPPLPVPSPDTKARRDLTASQEETRCSGLFQGEDVVGINVSCSLTLKPKTFTVFFQNISSGENGTVLECDLKNNSSYHCLSGKGYTFVEKANAFDVVVNRKIKCSDGRFLMTINDEETKECSRDVDRSVEERPKRSIAYGCPQKQPSAGPEANTAKGRGNGTKCLDATTKDADINKNGVSPDEDCPPSQSGGSPKKFQDKNDVNGLGIGLGLGIAVVVTVAIVAALFLNRKRLSVKLRKPSHDLIVGTDNHIRSQNKTEVLSPLNPGLPGEARHIKIQELADEKDKMVVTDLHEAAGDQSQCVPDRHMSSNIYPSLV